MREHVILGRPSSSLERLPHYNAARPMRTRRIAYEIAPGSVFSPPPGMAAASFEVRAQAQRLADALFTRELVRRLGIRVKAVKTAVVSGGWQGGVNPSGQVTFSGRVPSRLLHAFAAALGLIWRQDAVAVVALHPKGGALAVVLRKADGSAFSPKQAEAFYQTLYRHDETHQATTGFFEADGAMVFINAGPISDDQFEETLTRLAEEHLKGDVYLDLARADFALESTDWSTDHGAGYQTRLREIKRSDLLDWIEDDARPRAQRFLESFDWQGGSNQSQGP
jgi:hypothetical protein